MAFAAPGDFIQNWVSPTEGSTHAFGATINFTLNYSVFPDWVGEFSVYSGNPLRPLSESTQLGSGMVIDNRSGVTNLVGSLQVPVNGLSPGEYSVFVVLYANHECRFLPASDPLFCTQGSGVVKSERTFVRNITVDSPPHPTISVSPSDINFGGVEQGTQSAPISVTISNTGGNGSAQGRVTMPSGEPFVCTSGCDYDIPPGEEHVATFVFNAPPTAPLPQGYGGTMRFSCTSGCITTPTVSVPVSGISTASPLPPNIVVSPVDLNFGTVYTGAGYTTAWADRDITIRNTGELSTTVNISIAPASGTGIPQYQCLGVCENIPLPGGETVVRTIRFSPLVEAVDEAVVTVSGVGFPQQTVALRGEGNTTPSMAIRYGNLEYEEYGVISGTSYADPYLVDIGDWNIGRWGPVERFSMTNSGGGSLDMSMRILENIPSGTPPAPAQPFSCYSDFSRNPCTEEILTDFRNYDTTGDWTLSNFYSFTRLDENPTPGVKELLVEFKNETPGATQPPVYVRIRVNLILEPNVNIHCRANYGNVLVQKNGIPSPKRPVIYDDRREITGTDNCVVENVGSAPAQVTLPMSFVAQSQGTGGPTNSTRFDCITGELSGNTLTCGGPFVLSPIDTVGSRAYFSYSYTALKADLWRRSVQRVYDDPTTNNLILIDGWSGSGTIGNGFDLGSNWYEAYYLVSARAVDLGARVIPQSSPETDYGTVNVGDVSSKTFRIQMDALGHLNSSGVRTAITGNASPMPPEAELHYSIVNDPSGRFICQGTGCSSPSGGVKFSGNSIFAFRDATIEFRPLPADLTGPVSGTVTVSYNFGAYDPTSREIELNLTGQVNSDTILQVSPITVVFPDTAVHSSLERQITLQNVGAGTITVTPGTIGAPFSCVSNCDPFDLEQNAPARSITVRFTPTTQVVTNTTFAILTTAGNRSISLSGRGVTPPVLSIERSPITPPVTNFDFDSVNGTTNTSGSGEALSFNVCNRGSGSMNATAVLNQNYFTANTSSGDFTDIQGGECRALAVNFSPSVEGSQSATLTVNASGPDGWTGSAQLSLSGTGQFALGVSLTGSQAIFPPTIVNRSRSQVFTIVNTGSGSYGGPGSMISITSSPAGAFECIDPSPCEYTLGPSGSGSDTMTVEIRFNPQIVGAHTGTITLEGSGITFDVLGNGLPPRFIYKEQ